MDIDARTILLLTDGIALVAAAFLIMEWRRLRETFLRDFALGFLCIVIGCSLATTRDTGHLFVGVWLANSMVPLAHLFFLRAVHSLVGRRFPLGWALLMLLCVVPLVVPASGHHDQIVSMFNAGFVAFLSLKAAHLLLGVERSMDSGSRSLCCTLAIHGSFYAFKTLCAFAPGAFVDLSRFDGAMIAISLFEGVLVEVALAMSIAGALRFRREASAFRLAERDSLTGLFNRRGFETYAGRIVEGGGSGQCRRGRSRQDGCRDGSGQGALLVIDVDHFKAVNDRFGHSEGDRVLALLGRFLAAHVPAGAIAARLGGDEFAVLLPGIGEAASLALAEDLCAGFAGLAGRGEGATLSIGCAVYGPEAGRLADLAVRADLSLYDAKRSGRNRSSLSRQLPSAEALPFALPVAARA